MERIKRYVLLVMLTAGLILLGGCSNLHLDFFKSPEQDKSVITLAPKDNSDNTPSSDISGTPEGDSTTKKEPSAEPTPTPSNIQPTQSIELPVYTVNIDTGNIEAETALIPVGTKLTPELIVDKVVESMADRSIEVGIENVSHEGDSIIVSFYKDKAPLGQIGAVYEAAILDAIAQSLMDNLKEYKKVIYRAEGEAYISGHFEFGLNDVYLEEQ